jgi:hypothetical protein
MRHYVPCSFSQIFNFLLLQIFPILLLFSLSLRCLSDHLILLNLPQCHDAHSCMLMKTATHIDSVGLEPRTSHIQICRACCVGFQEVLLCLASLPGGNSWPWGIVRGQSLKMGSHLADDHSRLETNDVFCESGWRLRESGRGRYWRTYTVK